MTGIAYQLTRAGFSGLFGAAGLYLGASARRLLQLRNDWVKRGVVVDGTVVGFATQTMSRTVNRKVYAPVVTFTTAPGEPRQFTSSIYDDRPERFALRQRVKVRYVPDDPEFADLAELDKKLWPFLVLVFAAAVCAAIASLPFVLGPPSD